MPDPASGSFSTRGVGNAQGMMSGHKNAYDCIKAFSDTTGDTVMAQASTDRVLEGSFKGVGGLNIFTRSWRPEGTAAAWS